MKSNLLASNFLQSSWGVAILSVIIVICAVLILVLNYKYFSKGFLDRLCALIALIVLSPIFLVVTIVVKVREGTVINYIQCAGKDGKIIYVRTFCGNYGWFNNLPKLVDVLCGKLSIVGPTLMEAVDLPFLSDEAMARFSVKPGVISHLSVCGYEDMGFDEMFELDAKYAKKRSFFKDAWIVIKTLLYKIRGEGSIYLGKTNGKSYCEQLLEQGKITKEDIQTAKKYVEQTERNAKFK
jgi:lipopolysaccharide/colanic/teichoic acid biosynthesis glycosyltransferase